AIKIDARDRRHQRLRTRRNHQLLKATLLDIVDSEDTAIMINPRDPTPDKQLDIVVGVPLNRTQLQALRILPRHEDLRQTHTIIRRARLPADNRNLDVPIERAQRLADRLTSDPPTDDDNPGAHISHGARRGFPQGAVSVSNR
ncbi:MAG TPA: hypothetical protein VF526_19735, partial [Solirubrobacteraceae bacterium]